MESIMRYLIMALVMAVGFAAPLAAQDINFGNNDGEWASDGECDDRRFEGLAVAHILLPDYVRKDASDGSRLCAFGVIGLREY